MSYSRRSDKVRTNAPIINPFDAFTQPEFDDFIGGLTDKIRDALDPRTRHRNLDRSSDASFSYRDFSFDRSVSVGDSFRGGSVQSVPRSSVDTTGEHYEEDKIKDEDEAQGFEEVDESPPRAASNLPKVVVSGAGDEASPLVISDTEDENGSVTPPASRFQENSQPVVLEEVGEEVEEIEENDELEEEVDYEELYSDYPAGKETEHPQSVEELSTIRPSFIFDEDYVEEEAPHTSQEYSQDPLYHEVEDDDYSEENQLDGAEQLDEYIVAELDHLPPEDSFQELVEGTIDTPNIDSSTIQRRNDSPQSHEYAESSPPFLPPVSHSTIPSFFNFGDHHSSAQYSGNAPVASHGITWPAPEFASTSAIGFYPGYTNHASLTDLSGVIGEATNGNSIGDATSMLIPLYAPSESLQILEEPIPPVTAPTTQSSDTHEEKPIPSSPIDLPPFDFTPSTIGMTDTVTSYDEHPEPVEPAPIRPENVYEDYPETQSTTGDSKLVETSQHDDSTEAEPFVPDMSGIPEVNQGGSSASTRSTTPVQPSRLNQLQEETLTSTQSTPQFGASQATLDTPHDEFWNSQRTFTFSDLPSRTISIADDATLTPNTLDISPFRPDRASTMASDDYFASQSIWSASEEAPTEPLPTQETLKSDVGQSRGMKPSEPTYSSVLDDDDSPLSEPDDPIPVKPTRQTKKPRAVSRSSSSRSSTRELKALQGTDLALDLPPYRATRSSQSSPVVSTFSPVKAKGKAKSSPIVGPFVPKPPRKFASRTASQSSTSRKPIKRRSKSPSKGISDDLEQGPKTLETVEEEEESDIEESPRRKSTTKRRRKARHSLMDGDDEDYLPEETERSLKKRRTDAHELDVEKSLDNVDLAAALEVAEVGADVNTDASVSASAGTKSAQPKSEGVPPGTNRKRVRSQTPSERSSESSTISSLSSDDEDGSEFQPSVADDEKDQEAAQDADDGSQAATEDADNGGENERTRHSDGRLLKKQPRGVKLGLDGRLYKPSEESDEEEDEIEEELRKAGGLGTREELLRDVSGISDGVLREYKQLQEKRRLQKAAEKAEAKAKREQERDERKKEKARRREEKKSKGGDKMQVEAGKGGEEEANVTGEEKKKSARAKNPTGSRKSKKEKPVGKSGSVDPVANPEVGEENGGEGGSSQTVKRPKQRTKKTMSKKKEEGREEANSMIGVVTTATPNPSTWTPTQESAPPVPVSDSARVQSASPKQSSTPSSAWPNIFGRFWTSAPQDSGMEQGIAKESDGDAAGDDDRMDVD